VRIREAMTTGLIPSQTRVPVWLVVVSAVCCSPVFAQAQAAAPAIPRAADGKPDLAGIWQVLNPANFSILDHQAHPGEPAGQGIVEGNQIPYQPWAAAKQK
jgi:hypothetical protein